jgi:hypothetical protein
MANQNQGQGWGQQKQGQRNPVEEEKRSPSRPVDDDYMPEIENPEPRHSGSRTAQDADDVETGGGEERGPTKEFPR